MKKKFTKIIAIVLSVIMMLTGCATTNATMSTKINGDGSAKITMLVKMNKQETDDYLKALGYSNPAAVIATSAQGGYKTSLAKENGVEYYVITQSADAKKGQIGTKSVELSSQTVDIYATKDTYYAKVYPMVSAEEAASSAALGYNPTAGITASVTVEFTNNVTNTNGTKDSSNAKKVTFNINLNKQQTLFATTNSKATLESTKADIKKINTVKKVKIKSLKVNKSKEKAKKTSITLELKKDKNVEGYEIYYSTNKNVPIRSERTGYKYTEKTKCVIKNLKKGKKYYFKISGVKTNCLDSNLYVYGKFTKKSIKIK